MSQINRFVGLTLATAGVSVAVIGLSAGSAQAANIFENGFPIPFGMTSDWCAPGICLPGTAVYNEVGDDFTLSSDSEIQQVKWAGFYSFGPDELATDNFSVRIFDIVNGVPLDTPRIEYSNIQVSRGDFGFGFSVGAMYSYIYTLATPLTLNAGNYFLSIINNTSTDDDDWAWAQSSYGLGNPFYRDLPQLSDGSFAVLPWQLLPAEIRYEQSFAISGRAIPTPALLPGLIGMGLATLKKQRDEASKVA